MSNQAGTVKGEDFMNDPGYKRGFGAYKPKFVGIPEGYYPNSFKNLVTIVCLLFVTYGICVGIWVGLKEWAFADGTANYVYVWAALTALYIVVILALMIWGSKVRAGKEAAMIQDKIKLEKQLLEAQSHAASGKSSNSKG